MLRSALLIMLFAAGAVHAAMYKWIDDDGSVQYGAIPPPGREAKLIGPPPKVAAPPARRQEEGNGAAAAKDVKDDNKAANEEIFRQNCEAARKNLQIYQTARRIRQGDALEYLDDATREKGIAEANANIEKYCQ